MKYTDVWRCGGTYVYAGGKDAGGQYVFECTKCGSRYGSGSKSGGGPHVSTTNYDYWTYDATDHPSDCIATVYVRSCGRSEGQIQSATIVY